MSASDGPRGTARNLSLPETQHSRFAVAFAVVRHLAEGEAVTSEWLMRRFDISVATAKRWLVEIECELPVERVRLLGDARRRRKVLRLAAT